MESNSKIETSMTMLSNALVGTKTVKSANIHEEIGDFHKSAVLNNPVLRDIVYEYCYDRSVVAVAL